jgi:hypothetical protein
MVLKKYKYVGAVFAPSLLERPRPESFALKGRNFLVGDCCDLKHF